MQPARWLTVTTDPAPAVVDGRASRTRAAFFEEVARVLDFPPYFGGNWDALVDCLRDVAAADLVVAHAHELLTAEEPSQFVILLDIMARAAADGLTLTLCTGPDQKASLRRRIDAALRQD